MTSSDLRDVLNLDAHAAPRPAKKQKSTVPRPNLKGLAREVQNLGGDNPIAIVPEVSVFKKRRNAPKKPATKWELRGFQNSARDDGGALVLRHWRPKAAPLYGVAPGASAGAGEKVEGDDGLENSTVDGQSSASRIEDSAYAKYNVHVDVPQYSDEQYHNHLVNPDWTKDETDYLFELVKDFDLRWPLIWDRYDYMPEAVNGEASADGDESKAVIPVPKTRTLEDMKSRYYEIAAKMMAAQTPVQYMTKEEYALHETMANFNPAQEKARKEFAVKAMNRTKEEANEEESLLIEIKRLLARSNTFNEERRELYNRLDYPHTDQDISSFKSSAGLQTLLQNMMAADKSKKRKSLMGPEGVSPSGQGQQAGADSSTKREGGGTAGGSSAHRESLGSTAATPTTEKGGKKGGQSAQERRKLSEAEKYVYGVSYHDRLQPGPAFRYDKVNKLFTNKSGQQQIRISNTLTELDIPPRLMMPTAGVTAQFEQLLGAVGSLLDARKVTDKINAEVKLEMAKKTEREERLRPKGAGAAVGGDGNSDEKKAEGEGEEKGKTTEGGAEGGADGEATGEKAATTDDGPAASAEPSDEAEKGRKRTSPDKASRPADSHKRSASVLSTVSDKSAKRQKK